MQKYKKSKLQSKGCMSSIQISHIKVIISKMKINDKLGKILVMNRQW